MKKLATIVATLAIAVCAYAQEALWGNAPVESPVINEDGTVTFRYFAPKAVKVTVSGDFLPQQKIGTPHGTFSIPGVAELREGEKGVWEYTTDFKVATKTHGSRWDVPCRFSTI